MLALTPCTSVDSARSGLIIVTSQRLPNYAFIAWYLVVMRLTELVALLSSG